MSDDDWGGLGAAMLGAGEDWADARPIEDWLKDYEEGRRIMAELEAKYGAHSLQFGLALGRHIDEVCLKVLEEQDA